MLVVICLYQYTLEKIQPELPRAVHRLAGVAVKQTSEHVYYIQTPEIGTSISTVMVVPIGPL